MKVSVICVSVVCMAVHDVWCEHRDPQLSRYVQKLRLHQRFEESGEALTARRLLLGPLLVEEASFLHSYHR